MSLGAGSRLGPYEILEPLGAGGMGEVYKARDTRLGREVAVKVLPEELSKDRERLARFEREARAASALSDPHIVSVFDVGREADAPFLVTELVEGEDLRAVLSAGRLSIERAVELAAQIAEGLAAAHEKGIVHRDLKPENVLVTVSGLAKIADFGLAKLVERSGEESVDDARTVSSYTQPGMLMGTVGYMSPEQVRGRVVDHRSDIFSLGSMLHEMLTGARPFRRDTAAETMTAILNEEPPGLSDPRGPSAPALDRIVRRCLEKRPEQRFQSARDLAFALRTLASLTEVPSREAAAMASTSGVIRSVLPLPPGTRLAGRASPALAISRDGSRIAFVAQEEDGPRHLYVTHLDRGETERIPESEYAEGPFFSPDGHWVAFASDTAADSPRTGELRKHSFSSGLTQTVCPLPDYSGGCWGEDGAIYFVGDETRGLFRVPSAGGEPEAVVTRFRVGENEGGRCVGYPRLLPGGRSALVLDWDASTLGDTSLLDLGSGELRSFAPSGSSGTAVRTGHLLYSRIGGTLLAAPFDAREGRVTGPPVAVLKDLALDGAGGVFAISETGTLVHARGTSAEATTS
jgi:eukaryotic-like serine/threonine-protein kinase